jgi:hypothetical protein
MFELKPRSTVSVDYPVQPHGSVDIPNAPTWEFSADKSLSAESRCCAEITFSSPL